VICDNALLIAYATSKSEVSAKIIDEVARDLQLGEPSQVKLAAAMPEGRKEALRQPWRQNFQSFPATGKQLQGKRTLAGVGIGVLLAIVILAGTALYSQQSGSLAALRVNIEDLVGTRWKNPSQAQNPATIVGDGAAQLPMPHFRMTTSQASEFLISSPIGNGITIPMRKESRETDAFPGTVDSQSSKSETPITTSTDPNKQPQPDGKTKAKERTYRVVDASFVRDKPRSDANITGTLEPGTRIKVQSKTGDYFRVRSLDRDRELISGYVHREDAFFEPVK